MAKKSRKKNYGLFVNKETGTTYISRANANMPATVRRYDPKTRTHCEFKYKK